MGIEFNHANTTTMPTLLSELDNKRPLIISQPTKPNKRGDTKKKEMVLKSEEKPKKIHYEDSSPFWGDDTKMETIPELPKRPHSNHFSALSSMELITINPPEQILNEGENELFPCILEFVPPNGYAKTPILKTKKLKDQCHIIVLLMFSSLPNKPTRKFDAKLGKGLKSSKWHDITCIIMPLHFPNAPQRCNDRKLGKKFKSSKWRHK